jgi:hypothetical protein
VTNIHCADAVLHCDFVSRSGFNQTCCQIDSPGSHQIQTTNSGMVDWSTLYQSELGRLSAGRPVGPFIHSYKALVFAVC